MSTSMTRVRREVHAELLIFAYTRMAWVTAGVLALGALAAYLGSRSHALAGVRTFEEQVTRFAREGITLDDALAAPVSITVSGGSETIDNPLKYDFLQLSSAVRAVEPGAMAATALDVVTFLVIPLLFLFLGTRLALVDRAAGTVGFRAARAPWRSIVLAKGLTLAILAACSALLTAVLGWATGLLGELVAGSLRSQVAYPLVIPQGNPLWAKVAMTAAVALTFGLVGYVLGALTGSGSWPLVLSALMLFVAPFVAAGDPRNLMAVFGSRVYDFWGQFELRPPLPLDLGTATLAVAGYAAAILAVLALSSRRIPV